MTTFASSGTYKEVSLPQGTIRYQEHGSGPTLVFIHGILVNSVLWGQVIPQLSDTFRCIAPDLPLGAHTIALRPEADLTPPGIAQLIVDFLAALDLHDITLVGNDTGGAICQLVIARAPERIARLVLTNCDAYEAFFPPLIQPFHYGPRLFGVRAVDFMAWLLRNRLAQRLLLASVSHHRLSNAELDAVFAPLLTQQAIRQNLAEFLRAVSKRHTLEASRSFAQFTQPVLLLWGKDDLFFSASLARRLQQAFPHATLEFVPAARAFVPLDQPILLAQRIREFVDANIHS